MNALTRHNKTIFVFLTAFLAVFIFSGCSDDSYNSYNEYNDYENYENNDDSFSVEETGSDEYEVQTFNGYECTDDCSGHEAGYNWAEEKGIIDPEDCGGNSSSFIEGCESYAEEQ